MGVIAHREHLSKKIIRKPVRKTQRTGKRQDIFLNTRRLTDGKEREGKGKGEKGKRKKEKRKKGKGKREGDKPYR